MKIVFCGLLFCEESLEEAYQLCKGGVQMAPHLFESRLIEGLKKCEGVEIEVLSIPPIGSFPFNYKSLYSKCYLLKGYKQLGFLNIPGIKHFIQRIEIKKEIEIKLKSGEEIYTLVYSLYEPYLDVLGKLKKKYSNLHITILQPDAVPGRNGMIKSKKMVRWGNRLVEKAKSADDFVFLSKYLSEVIDIGEREFVVVDCICDMNQKQNKQKKNSEKIFLYTGTTAKVYGICNVVDAFLEIPEAQLWICGYGDSDEYINEVAARSNNIKHFGYLSQKEVNELRDKCDFLINPRTPTGTYTKYSFPSKTTEYLMSGKPVLMYRLEGLSNEYDKYLNYLTAEETQGIKTEIMRYISMDYLKLVEKAQCARQFMIKEKNAIYQGKKIISLMLNKQREKHEI